MDSVGFGPSSIRPVPGDTITFEFYAGTHRVIRTHTYISSADCMGDTTAFSQYLFRDIFSEPMHSSGEVSIVAMLLSLMARTGPQQSFQVVDFSPLWFYDGAPNQYGLGGVFSANPLSTGDETAASILGLYVYWLIDCINIFSGLDTFSHIVRSYYDDIPLIDLDVIAHYNPFK